MNTEVFDFQDGNGPVPAHRHVNGGGWVADTAHVDNTAYVGSAAQVSGNARVYGNAQVSGNAQVYGTAQVFEDAQVSGTAQVYGNARVFETAWVSITPICLTGGEYHVTITDRHIQVGCHCHTTEGWRTLTPQTAPFLESIRDHVLEIAALHQARVKEEK